MRVLASEEPVGGEGKARILEKSTLLATSATKSCLTHWAMDLAFKAQCKDVVIFLALCNARRYLMEASVYEGLIDVSLALSERVLITFYFPFVHDTLELASYHVASAKSPSTSPVLAPAAR